jgi:hypothetical protein
LRSHIYPGGGIYPFGGAPPFDPDLGTLNSPIVGGAATPDGRGMWLVSADGGVFDFGDAPFEGSLGDLQLYGPIVAMASTPDGKGYWLVALDGGVFAFGDAAFYGSMGGQPLNAPIVAIASTPDGKGYWLAAADGGVMAFGDAGYFGSMGGQPINAAITAIAPTPDGQGYWLVSGDGGVMAFGDAPFLGSMGNSYLNAGVVGMASTADGKGYWLVGWDGSVFAFGDAGYYGSLGGSVSATPITALLPSAGGLGYWLIGPDDFRYDFANPRPKDLFPGSLAIVQAAESQVQPDPSSGYFCNPYGPCEEWCSLFATWAMQQGGIPIPSYPFTGSVFDWASAYGGVLPPNAIPVPGDAVLYGTGPATVATSVHIGIVAQVWPDGAIVTIEGDAGPSVTGYLAVVLNGPYLPSDSDWYNGVGIYAFVQP